MPRGAFILIGTGLALLGGGFGLAFLVGGYLQPAPLPLRLLVMAMIGMGIVILFITIRGIVISMRDHNRDGDQR